MLLPDHCFDRRDSRVCLLGIPGPAILQRPNCDAPVHRGCRPKSSPHAWILLRPCCVATACKHYMRPMSNVQRGGPFCEFLGSSLDSPVPHHWKSVMNLRSICTLQYSSRQSAIYLPSVHVGRTQTYLELVQQPSILHRDIRVRNVIDRLLQSN